MQKRKFENYLGGSPECRHLSTNHPFSKKTKNKTKHKTKTKTKTKTNKQNKTNKQKNITKQNKTKRKKSKLRCAINFITKNKFRVSWKENTV